MDEFSAWQSFPFPTTVRPGRVALTSALLPTATVAVLPDMNDKLSTSPQVPASATAPLPDLAGTYQRPTGIRYGVLGFVCLLSMITYLDRVCFGAAASHLVRDLGLRSEADLKWAFTAFAFAYAAFEIPTGWLGDVFGPRKTLIRIVIWWSIFTVLTGMVTVNGLDLLAGFNVSGWSLMIPLGISGVLLLGIIRFLFGVGEAGAYPNITRALHNWFPYTERGVAQGSVWMSGRLMGGLTPLIWLGIVEGIGLSWRTAFLLFGVIGVGWCIAFGLWFRNRPEDKPEVNEAEKNLISEGRSDSEAAHANVPWLKLLTSVNLWAVCLMYFCAAYGWYFNITYLPRFLETQTGVEPTSTLGAIYKGGPLWMGAITCLVGGWLTDRFIRKTGNRRWSRRVLGVIGHSMCSLCYLACLFTGSSAFLFFLAISMAAFWNDLTMGSAWAVCQDIGKRHAAIVAGCMNTVGNLGGAVAGWVTGTIIGATQTSYAESLGLAVTQLDKVQNATGALPGYHINFAIFSAVYLVAVALWFRIDATEPVLKDEH